VFSTANGETALAVTPSSWVSAASIRVNISTPVFATKYGKLTGWACIRSLSAKPTLTTRPHPCSRIPGSARREQRTVP